MEKAQGLIKYTEKLLLTYFDKKKEFMSSEMILFAILNDEAGIIREFLMVEMINVNLISSKLEKNIEKYSSSQPLEKDMEILYSNLYIDYETSTPELFFSLFNEQLLSGQLLLKFIDDIMISNLSMLFMQTYGANHDNQYVYTNTMPEEDDELVSTNPKGEQVQTKSNVINLDFLQQVNPLKQEMNFVGRERELRICKETLLRVVKKNILLVGAAGVGKTQIVEQLALKMPNKIYRLDMSSLMSGTKYRGELEEKMKLMLIYFKVNPQDVLFIDEAHMISNSNSEDTVSLINILKEPMARGEIQTILATTTEEYNKFLKKDKAFMRRLNVVHVPPTDRETTLHIMKGFCDVNNIIIRNDNINYIYDTLITNFPNRNMPDIAIEFMDVIKAKSTYDIVYGDKYEKIEEQRAKIIETGQYNESAKFKEKLTNVKISKKEIVDTFAYNFNIDLKILEKGNLKNIFNIIKNEVIGHDEEIQIILKDLYVHFKTSNKPYSAFISGLPGIGKTLFFQVLTKYIANNNILKINCTDFSSSHSIDQLIGAPPGYIGFENGGLLTNFIQDNPNGVILFDEIEKANPLLYNYLLPLMDTGQITDRKGNVYNFKKGVIGFTSNVKSKSSISYTKTVSLDISGHFKAEFIDRLTTITAFKDLTEQAYELFYEKNKYNLKDKKELINEAVKNNLSIRQFEKLINKKIHERYVGGF